jgi:hypothetical protein
MFDKYYVAKSQNRWRTATVNGQEILVAENVITTVYKVDVVPDVVPDVLATISVGNSHRAKSLEDICKNVSDLEGRSSFFIFDLAPDLFRSTLYEYELGQLYPVTWDWRIHGHVDPFSPNSLAYLAKCGIVNN